MTSCPLMTQSGHHERGAANFAAVRSTFALSTHLSYKSNVFRFGDHIVKKGFKRRAWTTADVRTLKSLIARKKTPAGRIARKLKRTERDVAKGSPTVLAGRN